MKKKSSYLLILRNNNLDEETIFDFIKAILGNTIQIEHTQEYYLIIFHENEDLELEENLNSFIYDTNLYIKCYISNSFDDINILKQNVTAILNYFTFELKNSIYTEKSLIDEILSKDLMILKPFILKDYLYDLDMHNILITFMKNDLNTLKTSKILYMHRNTLINKLDRFSQITGYDPRHFEDAYIIYSIIKNK